MADKPTILVVEDDEAVRQTLVDMLELNGYGVLSATNGVEGLELARRRRPALVVTDVEMPGLTGFDLIRQLRDEDGLCGVPLIVVSAKVDRAATRRGMELGADDFITKPFTEDEVIRSVRTRLEKKELLDELDAFAHTVAHDLRNPLATLTGRLSLLEAKIGRADEATLRRNVNEAALAAGRLSGIIEELLVLAGVRRQAVAPAPLDMGAIVAEALARLEELLARSEARVERPASWPTALGHAPWVVHLWTNYVSNAAKYAGPAAFVALGSDVVDEGRALRFWVQDRGPGLDAAAQATLFVPFTQSSAARASGHGLGLSIVRRIAEKLRGRAGVFSEPGQGARFWFELPAAPSPD